jgi:hypothetical protein
MEATQVNGVDSGTFDGSIRYSTKREKDGTLYTGEIRFHGERIYLNNAGFYKLTG